MRHVSAIPETRAYPNANFEAATVQMTRDGAPVALAEAPSSSTGYGENTLVWIPSGVAGPDWVMPKPSADVTFDVRVRNVQIDGQAREFAYRVIAFDPQTAVAPPPAGPPPAEWPSNIPTPWGTIPTLKPTPLPSGFPTALPTGIPTALPTAIPTVWPPAK